MDYTWKLAESVIIHNINLKQKISEEDAWISTTGAHQRITFGETCKINLTCIVFLKTDWRTSTVIQVIFDLAVWFVHLIKYREKKPPLSLSNGRVPGGLAIVR